MDVASYLLGKKSAGGGGSSEHIQYDTMPTASAETVGQIIQYIGETTSDYTNGYFYIGTTDGEAVPTYSWENINVQGVTGGGIGVAVSENFNMITSIIPVSTAQRIIDKMLENGNVQQVYLVTDGRPNNVFFAKVDIYDVDLSTKPASCVISYNRFYVDKTSGKFLEFELKDYIIRLSWDGNKPTVTSTSGAGNRYVGDFIANGYNYSWTPSTNYSPVHKKYVDDSIASAIGNINTVLATLTTPSSNEGGE